MVPAGGAGFPPQHAGGLSRTAPVEVLPSKSQEQAGCYEADVEQSRLLMRIYLEYTLSWPSVILKSDFWVSSAQ